MKIPKWGISVVNILVRWDGTAGSGTKLIMNAVADNVKSALCYVIVALG